MFAAVIVAAVQAGGSYAISPRQGQAIDPAGYALLVAGPAALAGRRRFPAAVLAVTVAAAVGYVALEPARGLPYFALIVAFVNAVLAGRRRAAITGLAASYAGILWLPGLHGTGTFPSAGFAFGVAAWHLTLLTGAEWYRSRRQRALAVAHGREEEALRQATEERLRIARELHDVVVHSLAVIKVQANTALHLIEQQPERARSTLTVINDVSKQALVELRSVLGVLRQVDDELPRSPAPSLARMSELIARAAAAGISVGVSEEGARCPLPANVDLAGYRILQEALTNSARHAPGAAVAVRVAYQPAGLVIQVDDDGAARQEGAAAAGGNGIAGMTERARAGRWQPGGAWPARWPGGTPPVIPGGPRRRPQH